VNKKLSVAVAALCSFSGLHALAADLPLKAPPPVANAWGYHWYLEGRLGAPLPKDYDINIGGLGAATYRPSSGFHGAGDLGIQFDRHWRAELEVTGTTARDGSVTLGGVNIPHRGTTNVYTVEVNGLYSFDVGPWFRPFVGAGVGFANYNVNNLGAVGGTFVINDSKTTYVLGLHAGFDVPITQSFLFTARYTLADTGGMTFNSVPAGNPTTRSSTIDNILTAGFRFYFN